MATPPRLDRYLSAPRFKSAGRALSASLAPLLLLLSSIAFAESGPQWTTGEGLPNVRVEGLAVDPFSPAVVYAGNESGIVYQSLDAGASWEETGAAPTNGIGISVLAISPQTPSILYAGTLVLFRGTSVTGKLLKSTDGGVSWSTLLSAPINSLVIDPHSPETLYVSAQCNASFGCLYLKSVDGGYNWSNLVLPQGFPGVAMFLLGPSGVIYVVASTGVTSARVFQSRDGGYSWSTTDVGLPLSGIAVDANSPPTLYATTNTELFKSTDEGVSWKAVLSTCGEACPPGAYQPVLDVATDPQDPNVLYAATSGAGVFRSLDGGSTWLAINSGLPSLFVSNIVIDSAGAYLHAATSAGGVSDLLLPKPQRKAPSRSTHVVPPRTP